MRAPRPLHLSVFLLGSALLLLVLQAVEQPAPPPHELSWLAMVRIALGLPVVLAVPGLFLALRFLRSDVAPEGRIDPVWAAVAALGLSLVAQVLHLNLLRLVGIPVTWASLGVIAAVEAGLGLAWMRTQALEFAPLSAGFRRGALVVILALAVFAGSKWAHLVRDGSWYFYSDAITQGWDSTDDRGAIELQWEDGTAFEQGAEFDRPSRVMVLEIRNEAPSPQRVPLFFAVHGKVGSAAQLSQEGRMLGGDMIAAGVIGPWSRDPVERYWIWGTAAVHGIAQVPASSTARVELQVLPPQFESAPDPGDTRIAGWARISSGELIDHLGRRGHHHMHPFQLLNVTENVRWADEVATDYALAGRSPDGSSSLHQPPAWSYLLAPARELLARHHATASALLFAILLLIPLLALRASEDEGGALPTGVALMLALGAVQHGRLMVSDGSMNFPDSLYALALLAATLALVGRRMRVFVLWALLASTLRYPGVVVVGLAGLSLLAFDRKKRKTVAAALIRFGLGIAVFCGLMLIAGFVSGRLETWLFALYFETIPEHFGHEGALPLLRRPVEFLRILGLVGGGVALLALPVRGKLARVTLLTALLYMPFLAFIDHFSHHYFLPLIALIGASTAASIGQVEDASWRSKLAWAAGALAVGLFAAAVRLGI